MSKIILKNGMVFENNPNIWGNAKSTQEIKQCLKQTGRYYVHLESGNRGLAIYDYQIESIERS